MSDTGLTGAERGMLHATLADEAGSVLPMALERTVERILAARAASHADDLARAWDEGKATGFSRAMRYMSDEPGVDTNPPNPYRVDRQALGGGK